MSFTRLKSLAQLSFRNTRPFRTTAVFSTRRSIHEYLVFISDSKKIQDIGLEPTFAGQVLSEEKGSPRSIIACRASSIDQVERAIQEMGVLDPSKVRVMPLETVHTSVLEETE